MYLEEIGEKQIHRHDNSPANFISKIELSTPSVQDGN
jgi:hypothetical protein